MCDTIKLHQLNVPTDSFNPTNRETPTNKTSPNTFNASKHVDNHHINKPATPPPVKWEISPPPPSRYITTNTLSTPCTSSTSPSPSYSESQSLDTDNDDSGSDTDTSPTNILPITLRRMNSPFCDNRDGDVLSPDPSKSESENSNDPNIKPLTMTSIDEDDDEDAYDKVIDIPKLSSLVQINEDRKECDLEDDVEEIRILKGLKLAKVDEQKCIVYTYIPPIPKLHKLNPKATEFQPAAHQPVLQQPQFYVYIQRPMLEIRGNIECHGKHFVHDGKQTVFTGEEVVEIMECIAKENGVELPKERNLIKKKNVRKRMNACNTFMPLSRFRSMYQIPREFTEKMPEWIRDKIPETNVYEFIIKKLAVSNFKPTQYDTEKVFDFGLDGIYFKAKRKHPKHAKGKNKWTMDEIVDATEIKQDDIARPPMIDIVNDTQMCYVKAVLEDRDKLLAIINDTKWTKLPIYKPKDNGEQRLKLEIKKHRFITNYERFIHAVDTRDIPLIPIVMFDYRDKYVVEYVWIVRIDENIDIGISFVYKSNGKRKPSVDVAGIYLNKQQILQQHHVISPSSSPQSLSNFITNIDNLYIGDPEDDQNRIKSVKKRDGDKMNALIAMRQRFYT